VSNTISFCYLAVGDYKKAFRSIAEGALQPTPDKTYFVEVFCLALCNG
jgi:hypothetical protein